WQASASKAFELALQQLRYRTAPRRAHRHDRRQPAASIRRLRLWQLKCTSNAANRASRQTSVARPAASGGDMPSAVIATAHRAPEVLSAIVAKPRKASR